MITQRRIPSTRGFTPVFLTTDMLNVLPIKNNVIDRRLCDSHLITSSNTCGTGRYVLTNMAATNNNMNHGTDTLVPLHRKRRADTKAKGIIHSARVSFMVVAVNRASSP